MLSKPKYGWCDIKIGNWSDRASYLTDVPNDILQCVIEVLDREHSRSGSLHCDAEGWDYYILLTHHKAFIIEENFRTQLIEIDIDIFNLAKEVCNDIKTNLEDWVNWDDYNDSYTEQDRDFQRKKLLDKVQKIESLLATFLKHPHA